MYKLILSIFLISSLGFCQNSNKEITIVHNLYASGFDSNEYLYSTDTIKIKNNSKSYSLLNAISNFKSKNDIFLNSGIDTLKIKNNPLELIHSYKKSKLSWNNKQLEFIKPKLQDIENYKNYYSEYLNIGCCITMHHRYRDEFKIRVYKGDILETEIISRKSRAGIKAPWTNSLTRTKNYNLDIENILLDIIDFPEKAYKPLKKKRLRKYLVNKIIDLNLKKLYELSAYSYHKEIKELETEFEVKKITEVYGRGRYVWDEPKVIKITLQNDHFLPNVYFQFLASANNTSLYSRDSIKLGYKKILNRIQSITFITDYLKNDNSSTLDIYYFNNKGINEYNINGVNKNPAEWKRHDDFIQSLKWYETSNIKPSFNVEKAIKTSESVHCGCNYRFDRDFIEKAIFFEITSSQNASSIWFLLPDDTLLLYHIQSYQINQTKVLNQKLNSITKEANLPWACFLFDKSGEIIPKK